MIKMSTSKNQNNRSGFTMRFGKIPKKQSNCFPLGETKIENVLFFEKFRKIFFFNSAIFLLKKLLK